jgi:uncharacterized protein YozE (UPF0346 family)
LNYPARGSFFGVWIYAQRKPEENDRVMGLNEKAMQEFLGYKQTDSFLEVNMLQVQSDTFLKLHTRR